MEKPQTYVAISKVLKLDPEHYGHWKVSVKQAIQGIDMEAWFAFEDGWTEPTVKDDKGVLVPKPRKQWTTEEKAESKHNSQALSVIFNSLPLDQFNSVQGCVAAKEACDILQVTFKRTSNVKRTRLDNLASYFENLSMEEGETIASYSGRLSAIAQEAVVMGKRYKDKKLVKKFLRSIPDKFQPHRSAIDVSLNSDELTFSQVVGMMQSFEIQLKKKEQRTAQSFALKAVETQKTVVAQDSADEEKVGLLVRKIFRKMERGQRKGSTFASRADSERDVKRSDKQDRQCLECEGFGHTRVECPNNKRKGSVQCYGYKGFGHTKAECPTKENKSKSLVVWSDSESEDDVQDGDIINNFVALLGVIEDNEAEEPTVTIQPTVVSDSEDDEADLSVEEQVTLLISSLVQKKKEYDELLSEKEALKSQLTQLSTDLEEERTKSQRLEK
ncbi:PREDICTED: uncharacterized protein LOC104709132 [Camelina sativa]|uniref:Uncharacterized protein LOC104709132 n=1 Tax=Camelina sativa TaxID=90675 RepID=A0ABM0TCB2_CAMSA|nr:PREDICTED: uncharacterized protein LOC104709132 [Camelina sativa]